MTETIINKFKITINKRLSPKIDTNISITNMIISRESIKGLNDYV